MRAIEITQPGDPDVLQLCEREMPVPALGQVRIKVSAAGINRPDILQRRGFYPPPEGASDLPGLEVAGTIDDAGSSALAAGTAVMALLPGGGYAEYALVDARHVIPLPKNYDLRSAAALPETLYTVWANVFESGGLTSGQTLFVHGATSGIGTMAASLATAFNASVYGTAGTDEKCRQAEQLGFTKVFNYKTEDWADLMSKEGGADVVLDMVGGDYVAKNLSLLKDSGRHVSIAFLQGIEAKVNVMEIMRRRLVITGSTLRARSGDEKARLTGQIKHHVLPLIEAGKVAPILDKAFPLAAAAAAHARMEAGDHVGKIILTL